MRYYMLGKRAGALAAPQCKSGRSARPGERTIIGDE
jgi:hypothetical protein